MVKVVTLDPGHGGGDYGASGNGLHEKHLTLDIALATERYLKENFSGHKVVMTRRTDVFVSLEERVRIANRVGSDIFVSIHINSAKNPTAHGYESFTSMYTSHRNMLGKVHTDVYSFFSKLGVYDRGFKKMNFYVIRHTNAPAILTENLFIVNPKEANILRDTRNINAIARKHAEGIARALNLPRKKPQGGDDLTMSQYLELKTMLEKQSKRIAELEKENKALHDRFGLSDTARKDLKVFLKKAKETGAFSVDHSPKADTMLSHEAFGLFVSYLGRVAKNGKLPKL